MRVARRRGCAAHQVCGALQQDDVRLPLDPHVVRARDAAAVRRLTVAIVHQHLRQAAESFSRTDSISDRKLHRQK